MAATTQGPGSFHNAEAALGGADAVPDTPQAPNPGASIQRQRKGGSPALAGPTAGRGSGLGALAIGALLAIVAIVLLMMFGGFGLALPGR